MSEALSAPSAALAETSVRAARGWLGSASELLLVGGLTPIVFLLAWLARATLALDDAELAFGFTTFYAAFVINDPHFAVTYVLFYKHLRARAFGAAFSGRQRVRYWIAGALVPLLLGTWCALALAHRSAQLLGLLFQLMFLLVGWHYVKQGFGVLSVLSARRGVRFSARERMAILAHCYAAWAYAWASPMDTGHEVEAKGLVYTTLAHPAGLERLTLLLFIASALPMSYMLLQKHRREHTPQLFTPLTAFLCSVWSWTVYSAADPLVRYAIPALHSLQYLYMVWLLKHNEAREREGPPWFETSSAVRLGILCASALGLGFVLFHGAPALLDDARSMRGAHARALGPTPYFAALFAFVNIHHYFMDTVIWRHENPLTRYLRAASDPHSARKPAGDLHAT